MTQTQAVTPLRQRMLNDMKLRNMAASTRRSYVRSVADFSALHGRSPDELTLEDVRDYQLHLVARGIKASIPSDWTAFPRAAIPRKRPFLVDQRGGRGAIGWARIICSQNCILKRFYQICCGSMNLERKHDPRLRASWRQRHAQGLKHRNTGPMKY
jgi:hypothetical protein